MRCEVVIETNFARRSAFLSLTGSPPPRLPPPPRFDCALITTRPFTDPRSRHPWAEALIEHLNCIPLACSLDPRSRHPWAEALIERLRATPDAPRAPPLDIRVASCTLLVSAPSELPWESVWETCNAIAEDRGAVLHIQPLPGPHHEATVTLT